MDWVIFGMLGLRKMHCIARYWSIALTLFAGMSVFAPGLAHADDWGRLVILCLFTHSGPEQYSECVPPIEKRWAALRHGDPFPTCDSYSRPNSKTTPVGEVSDVAA